MPDLKSTDYEVVIIGAGPIGLACGIAAKQTRLRYLILEKGCLTQSVYDYPANMTFFSTSDNIELGNIPFVSHGDRPTRREALEYFRKVAESFKLNIRLYEKVNNLLPQTGGYLVETSKNSYTTRCVVIATGFFTKPNLLGVAGEDLPKVRHYFDDPHLYSNQNVLVVGGGNSAVDAALETYRKGAKVTLMVRKSTLKEGVKYWVKPDIENRIKEGSVSAFFNSQISHIKENEVEIITPEGKIILPNDFVLAMTGYHPDFSWLNKLGVKILVNEEGYTLPDYNPGTYESNLPGVFMAGTICGGTHTNIWYIENSRFHAEEVMRQIAGL